MSKVLQSMFDWMEARFDFARLSEEPKRIVTTTVVPEGDVRCSRCERIFKDNRGLGSHLRAKNCG